MDVEQTYSSKLALFQKPYIENSVDEIQYIDFSPRNTLSDGSVIEFVIPGTSAEYIDLKKTRLKITARIVTSAGNPITADMQVGLVNLSLSSLFRQVDVLLQDKIVSSDINIGLNMCCVFFLFCFIMSTICLKLEQDVVLTIHI